MAVTTWTRRDGVHLMPKLVNARKRGYQAEQARALGVSEKGLFVWLYLAVQIAEDGIVTLDRHVWRTPYFTIDIWSPLWREHVAAGLAETVAGGWRITPAGFAAVARFNADARAFLERVPLPLRETQRLATALDDLAARIPVDGERAMAARRVAPAARERQPDIVRVDQAVLELWAYRDDCHIAAWQAAGYDGPSVDVLSQVWEGHQTVDDVYEALLQRPKEAPKQRLQDVERNVDWLVGRGDLARIGDRLHLTTQGRERREAIEAETDGRFFPGWPEGAGLDQIWEDLQAVIACAAVPAFGAQRPVESDG